MINVYLRQKKLVFTGLLLFAVMGLCKTAVADTVIPSSEFEDENFYKGVIENFDTNGDGLLQESEAELIEDMDVNSVCLMTRSIKGLEHFGNLQRLQLNTTVESLEPIRNLEKLTSLNISNNDTITDFTPIYNLQSLTDLSCMYTNIQNQDLKMFSNLKLRSLDLSGCKNITDFMLIAEMTDLWQLDLGYLDFKDISIFEIVNQLNKLEGLYLTGAEITDFTPISGMTNLKVLSLSYTEFKDITILENLKKLFTLDLTGTEITDFSGLSNFKSINWLKVSDTKVKNLEFLKGMTELCDLSMNGCTEVEDYSVLGELTNLECLSVEGCNLNDIQWAHNLKNMVILYLRYNDIETLPDMTEWTNLRVIYFGENRITEEEAMAKLPAYISINENGYGEGDPPQNPDIQDTNENETSIVTDEIRTITSASDNSVSAQGSFESDIYLEATKIENTSDYEDLIKEVNNRLPYIVDTSIYDIWLYKKEIKEGENVKIKVQPNGNVKVMIKIEEQKDVSYHVFRQEEDDTLTKLDCYVEDGTLIFYSEHFSIFTVVISRLMNDEENGTEGNSHKSDNGNYIKVQQQGIKVPLLHEAERNDGGIAKPIDKIKNEDDASNENNCGSGNGINTKDENSSTSWENEIEEANKSDGKIKNNELNNEKDTGNGEHDKKIDGIFCIVIVSMVGVGIFGYDIMKRKRGDYMRNFQIEAINTDLDIKQ